MTPSAASQAKIETYTAGECHVFAVALHRLFGWQIEVICDDEEIWWQDGQDCDNFIPAVVHAYAIDAFDNAWDIRGVRPAAQIHEECQEMFHVNATRGDTCRGEVELATYVGVLDDDGEEVELPLGSYTREDIDEAADIAGRALSTLPGYGVVSSFAKLTAVSSIDANTSMAKKALAHARESGIPDTYLTQVVARALGAKGIPVGGYYMPTLANGLSTLELMSVGGEWFNAVSSHETLEAFMQSLRACLPSGSRGVEVTHNPDAPGATLGGYYSPLESHFRGEEEEGKLNGYVKQLDSVLQHHEMDGMTPVPICTARAPRL